MSATTFSVPVRMPTDVAAAPIASSRAASASSGTMSLRTRSAVSSASGIRIAAPARTADPPGRGAEQERLAHAGLVDHLLVELADAGAVGQEHTEQAAVGDGAAGGDGEALRAGAAPDRAGESVPDDPRAQLGELLGRVPPREQVEGVLEQLDG